MSTRPQDRFARARCALEGLSVGDAFGERFFLDPDIADPLTAARPLPAAPWPFTDDTQMALSVVVTLARHGGIAQDALARSLATGYDSARSYGPAMHGLLARLRAGEPWRDAGRSLFHGQGSFGNGAAMRVAPVGAYFADDLEMAAEHARRSAEVTHAHPEAAAGAIAVAAGAAWAYRLRGVGVLPDLRDFLDRILPLVPDSEVRARIRQARNLPPGASIRLAVAALGNGSRISVQDTVPFALWCAAKQLDHYEDAIWLTASGQGDMDTNCAIVGGIVAMYTGVEGIPAAWREAREPLPDWSAAAPDLSAGWADADRAAAGPIAGEDAAAGETVTLFRPVGPRELALVEESGYRAFPPRLPEQPIFYPVLNAAYATQIARDWNVKSSGSGFVTRFQVRASFLARYPVQQVGSAIHQEYWIPAEDLPEFNRHIVGRIEVIAAYYPPRDAAPGPGGGPGGTEGQR